MHAGELTELKVVSARIDELQERHWSAEKQGNRQHAQHLAKQLHGAQAKRKQLVDRIMAREAHAH